MFNVDEARFEQLVQKEAILDVVTNYLVGTEYPTTQTIKTLLGIGERKNAIRNQERTEIRDCTEDDVYQNNRCCGNCDFHDFGEMCTNTESARFECHTNDTDCCSVWIGMEAKE